MGNPGNTLVLCDALNTRGVPSGEILSLGEALSAAQIAHRATIAPVAEPEIGELRLFNLTAKFSKTPGAITSPPPRLGADTAELLKELGYSDERIRELKTEGVV